MGKLTALQVKSFRGPGRYPDGNGLFLLVGVTATKSWMLRIRVDGRRRDLGLGRLTGRSLAQARDAAIDVRRQCREQGFAEPILPPRSHAAAIRTQPARSYTAAIQARPPVRPARTSIPTFREAAVAVHAERLQSWKNGKHQVQWLASLEIDVFPFIGNTPVDAIDGPAVREVLAKIWLAKPETARRVRQRVGAIIDWSCAEGYRATEIPMRSLSMTLPRQPKKKGHFEAMPYPDVPAFLAAVRERRQSMGRFALETLILTAARSGEIRGARWGEIDLKAATWTVPAERMKAGVKHVVPVSDPVLAILEHVASFRIPCTDIVFYGQKPKQPLSAMTLLKVLHDMDAPGTVHGFRSSFRNWVAEETNYPDEVAEAALAHTIPNKVEAAYRRTDFLAKRRAMMADWAAYCGG